MPFAVDNSAIPLVDSPSHPELQNVASAMSVSVEGFSVQQLSPAPFTSPMITLAALTCHDYKKKEKQSSPLLLGI